jgi:uncharacterized protein
MANASRTPDNLVINPRNVMIGRGERRARWWKSGDPVATAFYNSLSAVFPEGEAFFIESVRYYRHALPETLRGQVDAFIQQEAAHSREHSHFNRQIREAGYDTSLIDAELTKWRTEAKNDPPDVSLAVTVATEHLTAIIAHAVLVTDRHFKRDSPDIAKLWKWHAIEEIEHKAVAYDTFVEVTQDLTKFERWKFRCLVLLLVSGQFVVERLRFMSRFFKQDGIRGPAIWIRTFYFLLVYPGLLRQVFPQWLAFFQPNFHPWQHDDRALIAATEGKLALKRMSRPMTASS